MIRTQCTTAAWTRTGVPGCMQNQENVGNSQYAHSSHCDSKNLIGEELNELFGAESLVDSDECFGNGTFFVRGRF